MKFSWLYFKKDIKENRTPAVRYLLWVSEWLLDASFLGYISFPAYHSLSHSGDIFGAYVLGRVHLAVIDHALPRVTRVLGSLHGVLVVFSLLLVHLGSALDLGIPLRSPLVKRLLPGNFPLVLGGFLLLHFFVKLFLSILLLQINSLYDF